MICRARARRLLSCCMRVRRQHYGSEKDQQQFRIATVDTLPTQAVRRRLSDLSRWLNYIDISHQNCFS